MAIAYFIPDQEKLLTRFGNANSNHQNASNNTSNITTPSQSFPSPENDAHRSTNIPSMNATNENLNSNSNSSVRSHVTIPLENESVGCWQMISQIFCHALRFYNQNTTATPTGTTTATTNQGNRSTTTLQISFEIQTHTTPVNSNDSNNNDTNNNVTDNNVISNGNMNEIASDQVNEQIEESLDSRTFLQFENPLDNSNRPFERTNSSTSSLFSTSTFFNTNSSSATTPITIRTNSSCSSANQEAATSSQTKQGYEHVQEKEQCQQQEKQHPNNNINNQQQFEGSTNERPISSTNTNTFVAATKDMPFSPVASTK